MKEIIAFSDFSHNPGDRDAAGKDRSRVSPTPPSRAIEPDRGARHLSYAGLVAIELEHANANPDHSGGCGARARRLQRQSGGQSLVAEGLPGVRRPIRGHQSLRSHQLRAEPNRAWRWRPLSAGRATKAAA